ncbi:phosphoesterase family-domain-containing protein [Lipomyces oligophaga]|uniref:phosphoesterase family-domain-containing protein n=1 Tax=Lipomyces oligophaga TaxID=45792 RepID=UPI0034CEDE53
MVSFSSLALFSVALCGSLVSANGLAQIEHIVLFMQENRAFDHYYGTMAGVRNFRDPNVQVNNGTKIWYQPTASTEADYLLPWYLNEDASYTNSTQCIVAGSNGWSANHNSWNFGALNGWVTNNTAWSWGYLKRSDIPTHFDIVEGWTVGDMYHESVIGPTNPNRVTWISGTINVNGSYPGNPTVNGGPYIENYETDGCETNSEGWKYACYPLKWKTLPEYLEDQNITWQVYQDSDNFDDNPLAWFDQYQTADEDSDLATKGLAYPGLEAFYEAAANGTLPQVSWIVGPKALSEHPPYQPKDGAWLQQRVLDAVTNSPTYNSTVLIYSYDETGGFGDHVPPSLSENGTTGEWFTNPEQITNYVPSGPGFRVPFYVVSPWTRGGQVFSEISDHNSQILFVEEWADAIGKPFQMVEMNTWRREHMSNLVNMFDFGNPDYSVPTIANTSYPSTSSGTWNGYATCIAEYSSLSNRRPPVPYGNQTESTALATEEGYKQLRGQLTEGRYIVITQEFSGNEIAWTAYKTSNYLRGPAAGSDYKTFQQRFILWQQGGYFSNEFIVQAYSHGKYLTSGRTFVTDESKAAVYTFEYVSGKGYTIKENASGKYITMTKYNLTPAVETSPSYWNIFSVSYNN